MQSASAAASLSSVDESSPLMLNEADSTLSLKKLASAQVDSQSAANSDAETSSSSEISIK